MRWSSNANASSSAFRSQLGSFRKMAGHFSRVVVLYIELSFEEPRNSSKRLVSFKIRGSLVSIFAAERSQAHQKSVNGDLLDNAKRRLRAKPPLQTNQEIEERVRLRFRSRRMQVVQLRSLDWNVGRWFAWSVEVESQSRTQRLNVVRINIDRDLVESDIKSERLISNVDVTVVQTKADVLSEHPGEATANCPAIEALISEREQPALHTTGKLVVTPPLADTSAEA